MSSKQSSFPLSLIAACALTLLISSLPDIVFNSIAHHIPSLLFWAKIAMIGATILISVIWKKLRPMLKYVVVFLVLYLAERSAGEIARTSQWKIWFSGASFTSRMLGEQLLRVCSTLVVMASMWIIKRHPLEFYLVKGRLNAPAQPVKWLGLDKPVPWTRLGVISAMCISLGTLAFLVIAGHPSPATLARAVPLLPAVLLFAAMNAFAEEMSYRAPQLATLQDFASPQQAVAVSAVYFGIGHYFGVPYGLVGVIMAGALGWWLGKCMIETKGLFWPWFIHFLQDVAIFSFMAVGSIVAGGGK